MATTLCEDGGKENNDKKTSTARIPMEQQENRFSVTTADDGSRNDRSSPENHNDDGSSKIIQIPSISLLKDLAKHLASNVDFFREHAPDIAKLEDFPCDKLPNYCNVDVNGDWDGERENGTNESKVSLQVINKRLIRDVISFPLLPGKGKLQVPMALVCEADGGDPCGKLVIISYWRQLKACQQRALKTIMQRFYVRPNVTNERLRLSSLPTKSTLTSTTQSTSTPDLLPIPTSKPLDRISNGRPAQRGTTTPKKSVPPTPWSFRCLETCTQLAQELRLCAPGENPKSACDLLRTANLEAPRVRCKAEGGCGYPALARNHGYCCRHGLHFGPTRGKANGRRGYLLLGDVYTRPYLETTAPIAGEPSTGNGRTPSAKESSAESAGDQDGNDDPVVGSKKLIQCSCKNETCVGIGYSPFMIQFDVNRFPNDLRDDIWNNTDGLNMNATTPHTRRRASLAGQALTNNPYGNSNSKVRSVVRLAPWHFHPEHREFLPDGTWKLVTDNASRASRSRSPLSTKKRGRSLVSDEDAHVALVCREWKGVPLPTYYPKDFLEEPAMKEYAARKTIAAKTTDVLPPWCREYAKLEEGPYSIAEAQRDFLWKRTIDLEAKLASQTLSFRTKERSLKTRVRKLQEKYDGKKFLKRRDKKRRRSTSTAKNGSGKQQSSPTSPHAKKIENGGTNSEAFRARTRDPEEAERNSPAELLDADGGTDADAEDAGAATNESVSHRRGNESSSSQRGDSSQVAVPLRYNHHHQQAPPPPQRGPEQHRQQHHPYSQHSYPPQHHPHARPHPRNHPHPRAHVHSRAHPHGGHHPAPHPSGRTMDLRHQPHYHNIHRPENRPEGSYPHHPGYHPQHDGRQEKYREQQQQQHQQHHHQEQQQEQQLQQQEQQQQQRYPEQDEWQRGYYE